MWMSRWFLAASCLALPTTLAAQQAEQPERSPSRATPQRERAAPSAELQSPVEGFFVKCLTQANQAEIALGRVAQQRASNKEVQAFAEQMVQDHTKMLSQLQRGAGQAGAIPETATPEAAPSAGDAPARRGAAEDREATADGTKAAGQGSNDLHAVAKISEEIHKRCLASAMEQLESKKGEEFDKCYVGMQIAMHQHMSDELAVLKNYVSTPALRQVITQGAETTTQHLAHAKNLMKTLDKTATESARKTTEAERQ